MIPWLRAVLALCGFVLATLILLPVQILAVRFDWPAQRAIVVAFHRILIRLLGLRVHVHGAMEEARPLMLAANHVSWMDIHVLGSISYLSFIAKADVAAWPLFGTFARLQHTVFVERDARRKSAAQAAEIAARIADGDALVLFPEGTTGDGNKLLPFKSSLFAAVAMVADEAHAKTVLVQPVSIAYTRIYGLPMGRAHHRAISYIGDETLLDSALRMLKHGGVDVDVSFGKPVPVATGTDRKQLARQMGEAVAELTVRAKYPDRARKDGGSQTAPIGDIDRS